MTAIGGRPDKAAGTLRGIFARPNRESGRLCFFLWVFVSKRCRTGVDLILRNPDFGHFGYLLTMTVRFENRTKWGGIQESKEAPR